jgi:hypothetical protein
MTSLLLLAAVVALAGLTFSVLAPAWGPGTHIQLTLKLLEHLRRSKRLRPDQELVLDHPQAFLYGNIAADIINFKAFGGVKNHCHNWNIHERLEAHVHSEHARAFVLGYLCHLAADIVAHNHFVPYHAVYNFPPRYLGHAYWEAIADAGVSDEEWHTLDGMKRRTKALHSYDVMVHRAVRLRVLGLRSNRWIFNNILLINCRQNWRTFIRSVHGQAVLHPLDSEFQARCRQQSFRNMLSVFYLRRLALLKVKDPTGRTALRGARTLRRELLRDFGSRSLAKRTSVLLAREAYAL